MRRVARSAWCRVGVTPPRRARRLWIEQLEQRLALAASPLTTLLPSVSAAANKTAVVATNAAPTVYRAAAISTGAMVGATSALSVLGTDDGGAVNLKYTWSTTAAPEGAAPLAFSVNGTNAARTTKVKFATPGAYTFVVTIADALGKSVTSSVSANVQPPPNAAPKVAKVASVASNLISGTSTNVSVLGTDDGGEANLTYAWSPATLPAGAAPPTFAANNSNAAKNTSVTFSSAGTYVLQATITDAGNRSVISRVTITVKPTLTRIQVTPASTTVATGTSLQFSAQAFDQFNKVITAQKTFAWSTDLGTISNKGLFKAPSSAGSATVKATLSLISGSSTVNVTGATPAPISNGTLSSLVQTLYADGSVGRQDMLQVFAAAGVDGVVDATELGELRTIVSSATTLGMPNAVQVLAGDVVNGNVANARYQGTALGNLTAGSSSSVLDKLVGKWFLGTDHPSTGGYAYAPSTGTLFVNGPSYSDVNQGQVGDCYFIASMGAIAKSSPAAISNMIVDNGDKTYTVRFYAGGKADYVTVDSMLPVSGSGRLVFDGDGDLAASVNTELWLPLLEKAYAQWNETGKSGQDGTNSYAGISGGWMADVFSQALGYSVPSIWSLAGSTKQTVINAVAKNQAVTIGTYRTLNGLYGNHAYTIVGYNSTNDTFTLHNPWGSSQPGPLTWAQLQAACDGLSIADPTIAPGTGTPFTVAAAWFLTKDADEGGGSNAGDSSHAGTGDDATSQGNAMSADSAPATDATVSVATTSDAISAVLSEGDTDIDTAPDEPRIARSAIRARKASASTWAINPAAIDLLASR